MRRILAVACLSAIVSGCATSASGPAFNSQPQISAPVGFVHAYIFRDKVLYLAQAPYIVSVQIAIDGQVVGHLMNGGYLDTTIATGTHTITAQSGKYQTMRTFTAGSSGSGYIEIADMTRMEGPRIAAEAAAGALVAGGNALQAGSVGGAVRRAEITGAINAVSQGETWNDPQRVWAIGFPTQDNALPRLQKLSRSE